MKQRILPQIVTFRNNIKSQQLLLLIGRIGGQFGVGFPNSEKPRSIFSLIWLPTQ